MALALAPGFVVVVWAPVRRNDSECKKRIGQEGDVRVKRLRACLICLARGGAPFASQTRVFLRRGFALSRAGVRYKFSF